MLRSQSAPGLGKGRNPPQGYTGDYRSKQISPDEQEAEPLFYALISSTVTKQAWSILAKDLTRRSPDAGAYLAWLIYRGPTWPRVAPSEVKLCCLELVSGTGSIGRAIEKLGWNVTSVDINPRFNPTHVADILKWEYSVYRPG